MSNASHGRDAGEPETILRTVSDSVEEMEAVCAHFGVDARFHQLEPGTLHVEIMSRRMPRSWLTRRTSNLALDTTMRLSDDCAGFGILTRCSSDMLVRGQRVAVGDVIAVKPGGLVEMTSPAGAEFVALDVPVDALQRICDSLGVRPPHEMSEDLEIHTLSGEARKTALALADEALRLRHCAETNGRRAAEVDAMRERESVLLARLCASIADSRCDGAKAHIGSGGKAFCVTRRYIEQHLGDPICLEDLCEVSSVSLRTLQAAFRSHTGVSPMVYVRLRRLNEARRMLLAGDTSTTSVTDVALNCGFTHLARFAGYYKDLFGESPSATLRRH